MRFLPREGMYKAVGDGGDNEVIIGSIENWWTVCILVIILYSCHCFHLCASSHDGCTATIADCCMHTNGAFVGKTMISQLSAYCCVGKNQSSSPKFHPCAASWALMASITV